MPDAKSDPSAAGHAHDSSRVSAPAAPPKAFATATTLLGPEASVGGLPLPAPSLEGAAQLAERDRVFEALFQVPAERQRVGRYMVLGVLGRGAMGTVLEAFDRTLDRRVAIKVLHRELATRHRARLVREAQALAKLSHPHVVQVYEVGEADDQIFVAMELVRGRSLASWVQQAPRPSWRECVQVYLQAGEGLAAAHAEGLVHRDFKPGNAVIDDKGRVRVLDFGLARQREEAEPSEDPSTELELEAEEAALASSLTRTGTVLGTPAYMPPEQMKGEEADARSDQFGFCVSLYEALYDERPFEGRSMEALMQALELGAVRPVPKGSMVPEALRKVMLRGLAIDPQGRWPSMDALLVELRRLVAPRRRTWWALGVTAGLLAAGVGLAQYAEVGFRCEGARAQLEGVWDDARKQAVGDAMLATGLSYAPATWERVEPRLDRYATAWVQAHTEVCEATRVTEEQTEEVMTLRMECLRERRTALRAAVDVLVEADENVVEKAVELTASLPSLGRCEDVELLARQRQRVPPPEDPQVAQQVDVLREQLADIRAEEEAGKYVHALEQLEPLLQQAEALEYPPLVAEAKLQHGILLEQLGKYADAEQTLLDAHALALGHEHDLVMLASAGLLIRVVGNRQARHAEGMVWGRTAVPLAERSGDDVGLVATLNNLGGVCLHRGDHEQAEPYFQRALEISERALGGNHPSVATSASNLAVVFERQGKFAQAKLHHERALAIREQVLGADHPDVAHGLKSLGLLFRSQGQYERAEQSFRRALEISEATLGGDHPFVATIENSLGDVLVDLGELEEAEHHLQRGLEIAEKALGAEHPDVASAASDLGIVFTQRGDFERAELLFERALRVWEKALGSNPHPGVANCLENLGGVYYSQGDYEQAEHYFRRALTMKEALVGADHPDVAGALGNLSGVLYARADLEQAELALQRALRIFEETLGADHPQVALTSSNLGAASFEQGKYEQAELHYRRALEIWEKTLGTEHPFVADSLLGLANVALVREQFDVAQTYAERAVAIGLANTVPPLDLARARFKLARASWADRVQRERARQLAEQAREVYAEHGEHTKGELAEVEAWLAEHRVR